MQASDILRRPAFYRPLLTVESDAKTVKGSQFGWLTGILYLSPSNESGIFNTCTMATAGCRADCLFSAGRGRFDATWNARVAKTLLYVNDRENFLECLRYDIQKLVRDAAARGLRPAVRVNGTSDIPKLAQQMAREFPEVQFYDYTKLPRPWLRTLANYHLTFSHSEANHADCLDALAHGVNVAVVFSTPKGSPLPAMWNGRPVFDGDNSDLRFLDPAGHVIGVRAKGHARKDTSSGFVVQVSAAV